MLAGRHVRGRPSRAARPRVPRCGGWRGPTSSRPRACPPARRGASKRCRRPGAAPRRRSGACSCGMSRRASEHPPGRERQGAQQRVDARCSRPWAGARDRQPPARPAPRAGGAAARRAGAGGNSLLLRGGAGSRWTYCAVAASAPSSGTSDGPGSSSKVGCGGAGCRPAAGSASAARRIGSWPNGDSIRSVPNQRQANRVLAGPGRRTRAPLRAAQPGSGAGVV